MSAGHSQVVQDEIFEHHFPIIYVIYAIATINRHVENGKPEKVSRAKIERTILECVYESSLPVDYKASISFVVLASDLFNSFWTGNKGMHSLPAASIKRYEIDQYLLIVPSGPSSSPRSDSKSPVEGQPISPSEVGSQPPPTSSSRASSAAARQDGYTLARESVEAEEHSPSPQNVPIAPSDESSSSVATSRESPDQLRVSPTGSCYPVSSGFGRLTVAKEPESEAETGDDEATNTRDRAAFDQARKARNDRALYNKARKDRNERAKAKISSTKAPRGSYPGPRGRSDGGGRRVTEGILKRTRDEGPWTGERGADVVKKVRK